MGSLHGLLGMSFDLGTTRRHPSSSSAPMLPCDRLRLSLLVMRSGRGGVGEQGGVRQSSRLGSVVEGLLDGTPLSRFLPVHHLTPVGRVLDLGEGSCVRLFRRDLPPYRTRKRGSSEPSQRETKHKGKDTVCPITEGLLPVQEQVPWTLT